MATIRVSNIEAKADASSPTIDEKIRVTSSDGRVLVQIDGKTVGITSVGINTTRTTFTVDANQNIQFVGIITAANVNTAGVSTFSSLNVTGQSSLTNVNVSGVSTNARLNVGTGGTVITTTATGLIGINSTSPTTTLGVGGTINYSGTLQQNGLNIIQWVEITPGVTEWSWTGGVVSQEITLNPSTIPSNARYVLADVFITASSSDHQNIVLGRNVLTNQKNWVDTRGQQPSFQFGTLTRQAVTFTYNGEGDGYSPNFGMWHSSQHIPTTGRTIYFNNFGNSGSNGWVYVVVKAYSL